MNEVEPGQMNIFDLLDDPPDEIFVEPKHIEPPKQIETGRKRNLYKDYQIRLNEFHFDTKHVGKEFLDWVAASGKQLGDRFTIAEVMDYYSRK